MRKPREEHGLSKHPLYRVWMDMIGRCHVPTHPNYNWYGSKDIVVCEEWRNSAQSFIEWALANGWKRGLDLDKDTLVKGNKVYSPNTCKFIPHRENMLAVVGRESGRKTCKLKLSVSDANEIIRRRADGEKSRILAEEYGVAVSTINRLLRLGR